MAGVNKIDLPDGLSEKFAVRVNLSRSKRSVEDAAKIHQRHCERSEAIHFDKAKKDGLLRCARK